MDDVDPKNVFKAIVQKPCGLRKSPQIQMTIPLLQSF